MDLMIYMNASIKIYLFTLAYYLQILHGFKPLKAALSGITGFFSLYTSQDILIYIFSHFHKISTSFIREQWCFYNVPKNLFIYFQRFL